MFHLCGCYYTIHSSDYHIGSVKHYLPVLDITAHSTILSTTSRTVLKQTFTNPSETEPIKECIYTFPLYDGVSVVSFTCRIGDKVLTGLVREKFKAKQIFNEAVARGETAGLLEQTPQSSDVFSTKLGNIPAGGNVIVEIEYVGELKLDPTGGIRFTIPTSIAPRYGEGPQTATHSAVQPKDDQGMKITVDVNMPEGFLIKGVQSPSHPIAVSIGTTSTATKADPSLSKASATLSLGSTSLNKDFVVIVQAKDVGIPKALLEYHPTIPNHRALMATLVPKFSLPPSRPEVVFVADRSGSMRDNIGMLKSAMNVFLKSVPVGVKFNICSFGSSHSFLWPQSQPYNADTLAEATSHINTFASDMGGTETFGAIKSTIERRFKDIPLELVLLTDGDIWSQDQLFQYVNQQVKESKGQIRIFPLGIGSGVSHALIEGLARAGNGFASAVQEGERLENAVVKMLRGALSPHITDYTLEVKYKPDDDDYEMVELVTEGLTLRLSSDEDEKAEPPKPTISLFNDSVDPEEESVNNPDESPYAHLPKVPSPKILQAPHTIPTLFAFSRTSVYLLLSPETTQREPTSIILRATSNHGPLALEIPVEVLATPGKTIHQLAAKKAVQDLEEGRGWLYDAKDQDGVLVKDKHGSCFQELVEREAVRLGEKFQIAGKWTSFVAVEAHEQDEGRNQEEIDLESTASPKSSSRSTKSPKTKMFGAKIAAPAQDLQDYQMQLMMLQQQNKNRKVMVRTQEVDSASSITPLIERGETIESISRRTDRVDESARRFRQSKEKGSSGPFGAPSTFMAQQEPNFASGPTGFNAPPTSLFGNIGSSTGGPTSLFGNTGSSTGGFQGGNMNGGSLFGSSSGAPTPFASSAAAAPMSSAQARTPPVIGTTPGLFGGIKATPPPQPQQQQQQQQLQTGSLFGGFGYAQPAPPPVADSRLSGAFGAPSAPASHPTGGLFGAFGSAPQQQQQQPFAPQQTGGLFGSLSFGQSPPPPRPAAGGLFGSFASAPPPPPAAPLSYPIASAPAPLHGGPPGGSLFGNSGVQAQAQASSLRAQQFRSPINLAQAEVAVVDWSAKSPVDRMLGLISLQEFEGSWPADTDEINTILGIDVGKNVKGGDQKVWTTLIVIKLFEIKLNEEEGTWELVVEKARGWLEGMGIKNLEELEVEAEKFVKEKLTGKGWDA